MVKKIKKDINACEDFFELTVTGYVIACAMELLGMSAVDEVPSSGFIKEPEEVWMKDDSERRSILMDVAKAIVEQHVDLSTNFSESKSSTTPSSDSVCAYLCETLSLGLLFLEFKDGIRDGNGNRIVCMEIFFIAFQSSWTKKLCY